MTIGVVNGAMIRSVSWADRIAISMSALCMVHCLLMPLLLVTLPSLGKLLVDSEALHLGLVYVVIPSSLFALGMGCTQHRRGLFIVIGLFGLSFLMLGIAVEFLGLDHIWEQISRYLGLYLLRLLTFVIFNNVVNQQAAFANNLNLKTWFKSQG